MCMQEVQGRGEKHFCVCQEDGFRETEKEREPRKGSCEVHPLWVVIKTPLYLCCGQLDIYDGKIWITWTKEYKISFNWPGKERLLLSTVAVERYSRSWKFNVLCSGSDLPSYALLSSFQSHIYLSQFPSDAHSPCLVLKNPDKLLEHLLPQAALHLWKFVL